MGGCTFSCWYLHWKCYFMCLIDCILLAKTMTTAFRVSKLDCSMKTLFWIIKIIQALLFSAFIKMWNCTSNQLWLIFQLMCARIEISILLLQYITSNEQHTSTIKYLLERLWSKWNVECFVMMRYWIDAFTRKFYLNTVLQRIKSTRN